MADWITLSTNDLRDREAAALVTALGTAALGAGQADPLPELLNGAAARVRAAIASAPGHPALGEGPGSIPPSLKELTVRLVLRAAKGRLNLPLEPDEVREAQWDERTLRELALGHLRVEQPGPATTAYSNPAATVQVARQPCPPRLAGLADLG